MPDKEDATYILHEIKTPISVINGYAQLALRYGKNDEPLLENALKSIIDETGNLLWIIQSSQPIHNWESAKSEKFLLSKMIEETVSEYSILASDRNWKCECEGDIYISVIKWGMKGVLRSLFDNAIKYSDKTGTIKIELKEKNGFAEIVIADDGIGIPNEDIAHIFDLHYRSSNVKNIKGSGIGLYLVKSFVEKNQGLFQAESVQKKGSKFTIRFPSL